ncbi:MAG TPA: hypothetical protein VM709_03715, partial [Candidatus Sulfotelmatobacter sp.]|nr:hypothetical protein [Candidatus Sulfotelmatobacter sp.]
MKKLAALVLFLFLTTGLVLADTPKDADPKPAKKADPAKPKAAKETAKSDSAIAAEIEELRQAIQSQQEQLQLLKEELAKRDRQIDEAREAAAAANARAAEASAKASEAANSSAEVKSATATLNTTVSDLKTSNEVLTATVAKTGANTGVSGNANGQQQAENVAIQFKGISITPGGFVAAETVSRTRATGATINTPFNGIPYPGSDLAKVSENSFTARQSRLSLLAEGTVGSTKLSGYYEADWLGTGVTSNDRQSNSYVFRQRLVFGTIALDNGWSVIGG